MTAPAFEVRTRVLSLRQQRACFATRRIEAGSRIWVLTGTPHTRRGMLARIESGAMRDGTDPLELGADLYLELDETSLAFNHSCDPNAGLARISDLVALRDILPDEEITYDYASNCSARNRYVMSFECQCGSARCRKRIGNLASIPPDQLRRYLEAGALQDYLRDEAIELVGGTTPANG